MSATTSGSWTTTLYRCALLAFPQRIRSDYGDEMVAAYVSQLSRRRELGAGAARRYALRAWLDAIGAGLGRRWSSGVRGPERPGGVGATRDWLWREIGTDLRDAVRALRKAPAFSFTVIAVLALGVGINGALSSAVAAAFLATPPYPEPERIVLADLTLQEGDSGEPPRAMVWSYPKFQLLEQASDVPLESVAAYARRAPTLTGRGDARTVETEIVTRDYFAVLGVSADRGREALDAGEVMITSLLATTLFGDDDPLGETLVLNGQPLTVVGVAPPGFRGLTGNAEMWLPMASVPEVISPTLLDNFDGHWLLAIGRLQPNATLEALRARMQAVGATVEETWSWGPAARQGGDARAYLEVRQNADTQRAVGVVSAAAIAVLLIACANLAVLFHARARARSREIAVRLALGASRFRVGRVLLAEVFVLAAAAGIAGTAVAAMSARGIRAAWPDSFTDAGWNMRFIDPTSLQFGAGTAAVTFGLAALSAMLFGLLPVVRATRTDVARAIRSGDRGASARDRGSRWLVAAEVAVALVLTVGAGLMISSLTRLTSVERGFDDARLMAFDYSLARGSAEADDPARFHDQLLTRVQALPGVLGATLDCGAPLDGHCWITGVRRAGPTRFPEGDRPSIGVHLVDAGHFDTLGIPLRRGRLFRPDEGPDSPPVVIINEAAATRLFPDGPALGEPVTVGVSLTSEDDTAEIIGIVGDVLYDTPADGVMPEIYVLHRQESGRSATVIVRTHGEPLDITPALRAELSAMAPEVPMTRIRSVDQIAAAQVGDTTAVLGLLGLFATLAIVLSATGVWGTVAQAVGQRRREMGIRLALGARSAQVVAQSLRSGLAWAIGGALLGLAGAAYLTRYLDAMLYDVAPTDALSYAGSALLLVAVTALASYLPARRAGRVDPVETLRAD